MESTELKKKLTLAGLNANHWARILKSELQVTLPEQIQCLGETHLKVLERFTTKGWEKKALRKLSCIKIRPASSKAGKEGEPSIVSKLIDKGLDGEYWANALKSKLGVTEYEQISNLNVNNINKLKCVYRYEWEENVLRTLFCHFQDILKLLGLDKYHPCKISVSDAIAIDNKSEHHDFVDIPWMILKNLLMIDFRSRDQSVSEVTKSTKEDESDGKGGFDWDAHIDCDDGEEPIRISTLDALVALFTCCDNFLKQIVAQKLFVCKLAIPFLYPLGSDDKLGLSLWALRTIIVQYQNKKEALEIPVTEGSFPLVTFIRLGRPPFSKSKLMNDVLRDDSHKTFFNVDCDNGRQVRNITDGLIECSWFISGKEEEHLPGTTMFLNLRGDATTMEKQLQFLQEISTVVVILVTAVDLAKLPIREKCTQFMKADAKIILFLITSKGKKGSNELRDCRDAFDQGDLQGVPIILSNTKKGHQKNASELKNETRNSISHALKGCSVKTLEDCAQHAMDMGIIIDEYDEACIEGKKIAEKTCSHMKGKKIEECRTLFLPLQGAEWIKYSKLLKKQHRVKGKGPHESLATYADEVQQNMNSLRKKQVEMCKRSKVSPLIRDFISGLNTEQTVRLYFLRWMSFFLDGISRTTLPGVRREYHNLWANFQEAKKDKDEERLNYFKLQVDSAEQKLANASLGLENLFRELGQVYEAMTEGSKIEIEPCIDVERLAETAAELLLHGIPLELVDGDAASVPIKWVCAVLGKLEKLISEKRLYVISVLGVQSSGKSTLLNTMFGLQFAVSAGRCTRGAYMQLVPVKEAKEAKEAKFCFDYVVVVDTEGLRAPELGQLKHEHDNELATLVIGLGDVTLINVKGENTAEIKDILQIAVHAFLRMNCVERHIEDKRTCLFIHQNVPAANADELMRHGCQKLKESLDAMAKEAAISEEIANIHSFSQIIKFDIEKHVWFFSDLWQGNPPMAPANPGYSEKVNAVKLDLLETISKQKTFLTASELSIRLNDLWKGVLADDFVFSFRNSLEVKAYNSLQSTYYTLELGLQNELKTWSHDAEIVLKRCETTAALESAYDSLVLKLQEVMNKKFEEIKASLQEYLEKSDMRDIIIQWKHSKISQLQTDTEEMQREGKRDLGSIKDAREVEILHAAKWSKHDAQRPIMKNAVALADKLKGEKASDDILQERFDLMWKEMAEKLETQIKEKELKLDLVMEGILQQRIHDHRNLLRDELKEHPLNCPPDHTPLDSITIHFVEKDHISLKLTLFRQFKNIVVHTNPVEDARKKTHELSLKILKEIGNDLEGLSHDKLFQKSQAIHIIKKVVDKIDFHNQNAHLSKDCNFTILPTYVVKLAVYVSQHCVQVFGSKHSQYIKKHGVKAKLKATAWTLFKNRVEGAAEEVMAGELLCTYLKDIVQETVKKAALDECADEILAEFRGKKYFLLMEIMKDLAVKENLDNYLSFINYAKGFALQWLEQYTEEKIFSWENERRMSRYADITKSHIDGIMQCITKSISHATSEVEDGEGKKMEMWIESFCDSVSKKIAVPIGDLSDVSDRLVMDFDHLEKVVLERLSKVKDNLENTVANETQYAIDWSWSSHLQKILNKIWGCPEQCPFCHEPCTDPTPNHWELSERAHACMQHRPSGIAGVHSSGSLQLRHEICNFKVQCEGARFNKSFCQKRFPYSGMSSGSETEEVYHKYVEYKKFLPDWDIAPDGSNSASKYWMWFMATYQNELKSAYNLQLPDLPESWTLVTKQEALEDLPKIHH